MAEKQKSSAAAGAEAVDLDEFSELLEKDFKVKKDDSDRLQQLVRNLALAAQSRSETTTISSNAIRSIKSLIAGIDKMLSAQMNEILHAPEVREMEGTWRGLWYLVNNTETDEMLKIRVMNIGKTDLGKTLKRYKGILHRGFRHHRVQSHCTRQSFKSTRRLPYFCKTHTQAQEGTRIGRIELHNFLPERDRSGMVAELLFLYRKFPHCAEVIRFSARKLLPADLCITDRLLARPRCIQPSIVMDRDLDAYEREPAALQGRFDDLELGAGGRHEVLLNLLSLTLAEKPVVDKYTCQLISDRALN